MRPLKVFAASAAARLDVFDGNVGEFYRVGDLLRHA